MPNSPSLSPSQNIIALILDFDGTLIRGNMQDPLFAHYKVDKESFWERVSSAKLHDSLRQQGLHFSETMLYLNQILEGARGEGDFAAFKGLNNTKLKELGRKLSESFFDGVPEFFDYLKRYVAQKSDQHMSLEIYILSSGLRQMIIGNEISSQVDGIWGCEFVDGGNGVLAQIVYALDDTSKTRALFEINKGSNKDQNIDVNAQMEAADRRIPFEQMIYIADGPSDIPVFSLLKKNGGKTLAVYDPAMQEGSDEAPRFPAIEKQEDAIDKAHELHNTQRVEMVGPADYRPEESTMQWVCATLRTMIRKNSDVRKLARSNPPGHHP